MLIIENYSIIAEEFISISVQIKTNSDWLTDFWSCIKAMFGLIFLPHPPGFVWGVGVSKYLRGVPFMFYMGLRLLNTVL